MKSVNAILLRVPTHSHSILFYSEGIVHLVYVAFVLFWFTGSIQSLGIQVQQVDRNHCEYFAHLAYHISHLTPYHHKTNVKSETLCKIRKTLLQVILTINTQTYILRNFQTQWLPSNVFLTSRESYLLLELHNSPLLQLGFSGHGLRF